MEGVATEESSAESEAESTSSGIEGQRVFAALLEDTVAEVFVGFVGFDED